MSPNHIVNVTNIHKQRCGEISCNYISQYYKFIYFDKFTFTFFDKYIYFDKFTLFDKFIYFDNFVYFGKFI